MQLIALLRNDPWTPLPGRVIRHSMEDGPRLSENWHEATRQQNRALVLQAIGNGWSSVAEIAEVSGLDYTTAKKHLDKLIELGKVEMIEAKGGKGRKKIYRVTK